MLAYISISFSKRQSLNAAVQVIVDALNRCDIKAFVFVDQYRFEQQQQYEMMQQAFADIDRCDLLIAEVSEKGIGIGVEVGYAKAKGKPVIYLRNEHAEHSTTVAGASDHQIVYKNEHDLERQLKAILAVIK